MGSPDPLQSASQTNVPTTPATSRGGEQLSNVFAKHADRIYLAGFAAICILGGYLRWQGGSTEFWMDEIWTWKLAQLAQTPLEVVTKIKHDNSHLLNTLIFYFMGPECPWMWYRWPAIACSTLAVPVAGAIFWDQNRRQALLFMLLVATNHLLIHYGSEARGYGYLTLMTVLAIWLAKRSLAQRRPLNDTAFAVVSVLGFAAHSTFIFCFLSIGCWFLYRYAFDKRFREFGMSTLLRSAALPIVFVGWMYLSITSQMKLGGGEVSLIANVILELLTSTFGGSSWELPLLGLIAMVAIGAGLLWMWRQESDMTVLCGAALLIVPGLVLMLMQPQLIYTRYFLVQVIFLLLVTAWLLNQLAVYHRHWGVSIGIIAMILCGNLVDVYQLVKSGRGHYREAIGVILAEDDKRNIESLPTGSELPDIRVSGDYDGRHHMILDFYKMELDREGRIQYLSQSETSSRGVDWMLLHHGEADHVPDRTTSDIHGNEYELRAAFPYCGTSGWNLYLYRRQQLSVSSIKSRRY